MNAAINELVTIMVDGEAEFCTETLIDEPIMRGLEEWTLRTVIYHRALTGAETHRFKVLRTPDGMTTLLHPLSANLYETRRSHSVDEILTVKFDPGESIHRFIQ
jgi:hypothetical protein